MPQNFGFVIERSLAGMERPGTFAPLTQDLAYLKERGIGAIVSLTEMPLSAELVETQGFRYLHLPVMDFTPPTLEQVSAFVAFYRQAESEALGVVVHCAAGRGRTGTVLACALVDAGNGADEAIQLVRRLRPGSIETPEQEDRVREYARHARRPGHGSEGT